MRLTTKGRFAVTAMVDLALNEYGGPVALATISDRRQISLSYLEQLFGKLRRRGIVDSVRGPGGGYCLARRAELITIAQIIDAVDEPVDATQCAGRQNCLGDQGACLTHDLWSNLNKIMSDYLSAVSLKSLVERERERSAEGKGGQNLITVVRNGVKHTIQG